MKKFLLAAAVLFSVFTISAQTADTKEPAPTVTKIKTSELPKAATDYIKKTYPAETGTTASKVVYAGGGQEYQFETKSAILSFDPKGNFKGTYKKAAGK